jgi:hypothetical protein
MTTKAEYDAIIDSMILRNGEDPIPPTSTEQLLRINRAAERKTLHDGPRREEEIFAYLDWKPRVQ